MCLFESSSPGLCFSTSFSHSWMNGSVTESVCEETFPDDGSCEATPIATGEGEWPYKKAASPDEGCG